jgi:hypothetical protein
MQLPGRLQPLEHLIAVAFRHHHIEQHEIESAPGDQRQRFLAVGSGRDCTVAFAIEPPGQEMAIILDIVDDQDACTRQCRLRLGLAFLCHEPLRRALPRAQKNFNRIATAAPCVIASRTAD